MLLVFLLFSSSSALRKSKSNHLVLTDCSIEATPSVINTQGSLTITAQYFLTSTPITLNLYLSRTNIISFFPSSFGSNKVNHFNILGTYLSSAKSINNSRSGIGRNR